MIDPIKLSEECYRRLPRAWQTKPWEHLNHGINPLVSEQELDAYIASYGEIHIVKCLKALQNFPFQDLDRNFEIVDWGCGQGIATLVLLDYLDKAHKLNLIRRITLIEPSEAALLRAQTFVKQSTLPNTEIITKQSSIPCSEAEPLWQDLHAGCITSIHLFSNILDIHSISLLWLAKAVEAFSQVRYVVCVGPKYGGRRSRIQDFHSFLGTPECIANFRSYPAGYTTHTRHAFGIEVMSFKSIISKAVNSDYQAQSDQRYIDEFAAEERLLKNLIPDDLLKAYHRIKEEAGDRFEVYLKPKLGSDRPDIFLLSATRGAVLINLCDITSLDEKNFKNNLEIAISRVEAIKSNLFNTHIKSIKIDCAKSSGIYNCLKTALFFTNLKYQEVSELIKNLNLTKSESDFLIKLTPDNLLSIPKYDAKGFKWDYYAQIRQLISQSWHKVSDGDLNIELKDRQRIIAYRVARRIRTQGVAGSGKTLILAHRAVAEHLRTGENVLILSYNITLIRCIRMRLNQVPASFDPSVFEISTYHHFFFSKAKQYHWGKVILSDCDKADYFSNDNIPEDEKYKTIIIDEVQDYRPEWIDLLQRSFLKKDGNMALFGDGAQNIYNIPQEDESKMPTTPGFSGRWNVLTERISMRVINESIAHLASSFAKTFQIDTEHLKPETYLSGLNDYKVEYYLSKQKASPDELSRNLRWFIESYGLNPAYTVVLANRIELLRLIDYNYRKNYGGKTIRTFESEEDYQMLRKTSSAFILDMEGIRRTEKVHFTTETTDLKFATIASFKGWEAKNVILFLDDIWINPDNKSDNHSTNLFPNYSALIYCAITRAKENLFILSLGNSAYHEFFQKNVKNT